MKQFFLEYILIPRAEAATNISVLLGRVNKHVINPAIQLLFVLAFIQFIYGLYNFFTNKDDTSKMEDGKRHMLWGVIGMAIMVSVFGIMSFITNTIGVGNVDPSAGGDVSSLILN